MEPVLVCTVYVNIAELRDGNCNYHGNKCRFTVSYNYYCFLNGLVSFAFTRLGAEFY